jgi:UDP-N-acetylglucosamine--N-acetylmuramyl-(pentapeptide) pyrophosphoryl-undecaprenol N-acetylglucosamine transferase
LEIEVGNETYVIAGGGTGGHVYPALAIAMAIRTQNPLAKIHFVGTQKGIESRLVPQAGYPLHCLPAGTLKNTNLIARLKTLFAMPMAFIKSARLIRELKPRAVLGVGGYASGPFVMMASLLGVKTAVWEPNAYPGWTNRLLIPFVQRAFVVFENAGKIFPSSKVTYVGMPIRKEIAPRSREAHSKLRVLVFGGSQGARGINTVVAQAVAQGGSWMEGIELVHQTGKLDFEKIKESYVGAPEGFSVLPYLDDMDQRYAWADIVICRSGASTVAELAAAQKCAILIPFPFASDNHQEKNAESLVEKGAAQMVLQKDFTLEKFLALMEDFTTHPEKIRLYEERIAGFHKAGSAEFIASAL